MLIGITREDLDTGISIAHSAGDTSTTRSLKVIMTENLENIYFSVLRSISPKNFCELCIGNWPNFKMDLSSIHPDLEPQNETFIYRMHSKVILDEEDFEFDEVFRMPPKTKYKIRLKIKSIKKAVPRFIPPED